LELWLALTATILELWKLAAGERTTLNCWDDPKAALEERVVAGATDPATDIALDMVAIVK
jgi:hypothetical protein